MRRGWLPALLLLSVSAVAQGPAESWRTIETEHFRVHYPREYETWALRAAGRLEPVRERVSAEVGFTPPQTIDVLVVNPIAEPNGSAWPFLDTPRMIFYAEPPAPDEQLGSYGHWIDLLSVHETAHMVHMLRPSRNPLRGAIESVLPLNPITLAAPRWVLEGYATVIEGRLTGAGRPGSTTRALILRRWAETGRMPSYAQLDSDRRFLGMSMAYLAGSAYLEWLEQRAKPGALRDLWARMTARHKRSFSEAFTGVFGERPDRLYGQFVAELTASAMTIRRSGPLREGELFQDTARASGDPAVSPDGTRIAFVVRERAKPARLVIWSTGPAGDEQKKYDQRIAKILERDPEDVAPLRAKPLPRKAIHSLVLPDGGDIVTPRWTRDGKRVVFSHRMPDAGGFLHFDLFAWDFERLRRITHLADVRDADPYPDGTKAIAVRSRFGASQLVTVDLESGDVSPLGEASIDQVFSNPRVSPDGRAIAFIQHRDRGWQLAIRDDRAVPRPVPTLPGEPARVEWRSDGELVATLFAHGFAELHRLPLDEAAEPLTRTAGGAFDPAPSPDGRIFFTSLDPDGFVLRVITPEGNVAAWTASGDASLVPAVPPLPASPLPLEDRPLPASHPYGIGRQEWSWFAGGNVAPDQHSFEAGIRLGDVAGRLDTILVGSFATDGLPEGAALATAWRGWPVEIGVHAWNADDSGVEARAAWSRRFARSRLWIDGGANSDRARFARGELAARRVWSSGQLDGRVGLEVSDARHGATGAIGLRAGSFRFGIEATHRGGDPLTLGGLASSLLPHSAYLDRVLDPALPPAVITGEGYDGWRVEMKAPALPVTAFYRRHELGDASLALAGAELAISMAPSPILKFPALDLTAGVAYVLDAPMEGETKWWFGMRWHP